MSIFVNKIIINIIYILIKVGIVIFNYTEFGKTIRKLRKNTGFKLIDIAEELNIHESYLGQIERGTAVPSVEIAVDLANYFHISFQQYATPYENINILLQNEVFQNLSELTPQEKKFIYKSLLEFI